MRLLWRTLWQRRSATLLTTMSMTVCFSMLLAVETLHSQARAGFAGTVSGVDLLVGPRGDPVGLLLQAIFHRGLGSTGLSWESYKKIASRPEIAWTVPLVLGDTVRGFPVLGTNASFFEHYRYGRERLPAFSNGRVFTGFFEAVLGFEVARNLGYRIGDKLAVSHGQGRTSFSLHDANQFTVAGILAETGTPIDRAVYIHINALQALHLPDLASNPNLSATHYHDPHMDDQLNEKLRITAMLVGLKNKSTLFTLQSSINNYRDEPLTAVIPGMALQSPWGTLDVTEVEIEVSIGSHHATVFKIKSFRAG